MVKPETHLRVGDLKTEEWVNRWPYIRLDQFNDISHMRLETLNLFNKMVEFASQKYGWSHHINSDYRDSGTGQHPLGRAIDFYFYRKEPGDVDVITQFFWAMRFDWGGIGFYPYWNTPGCHVDTRFDELYRALWWRDNTENYRNVAEYFS